MTYKERTNTHQLIPNDEFRHLVDTHDQHCITLYIPTVRAGDENDHQLGQLSLKNAIKRLKDGLGTYQLSDKEIEDYLRPVSNLLDNNQFWRNQSDCLAIFLCKERLSYYTLPIQQDEFVYIADHFYLMPVIPLLHGDKIFYLLTISLNNVRLFECSQFSVAEILLEDQVPQKIEEAVGFDIQNKSLQFRTGQGGEAGALFHGQGAGKDDKDVEVEKYLRAIDNGLSQILADMHVPLVLASVDHYHPIFKKITAHANLNETHISGNHETTDPYLLHEMAWPLVEHQFLKEKKHLVTQVRELSGRSKTSIELGDIIRAAVDGRIQALFIQSGTDRMGLYDHVNRSLIVDEVTNTSQASLYNLAAVHTWQKGGQVYFATAAEMPIHGTTINALFRY